MPPGRYIPLLALALALALPAPAARAQQPDSLRITGTEIGARLRLLASDLFEGRAPGTYGDTLTTTYLASELSAFGLRPGADSGWLQPVTIVVHQPDSTSPNTARLSGRVTRTLEHGRDIRFANDGAAAEVMGSGELVFVGHAIYAPPYQWDDFDFLNLRGKIAVILLGEPTLAGDSSRFNGRRASRFGSMDTKLAELGRRGAVGALLVRPAGSISRAPVTGRRRLLRHAQADSLKFFGALSDSVLATLLPRGRSLAALLQSASRPGFRPLPLGVRLDYAFRTRPIKVRTNNVIGVIPGRDSALAREHVVLSAHWDAYGIGRPVNGDSIYNGALDDASGVSGLLAVARALAAYPQRRSLTFLFTTAEEWGLLGARAYVCEGPLPMERVAANLNVDDGIELWGVKRDAAPLGTEHSTLGAAASRVASKMGLRMTPDPYEEEGFFLRADNFPFAEAGVPALYMALGTDAVGQPPGYVDGLVREYLRTHYHRPSDDYETVVRDLEGTRQFAEFVRDLAIAVANNDTRPEWLPGAEFQRAAGTSGCAP